MSLKGSAAALAFTLLLGSTARGAAPAPASDPDNTGGWVLFEPLSDEFDGTELDEAKWARGSPSWQGRQPVFHSKDPAMATVSGGNLVLRSQVGGPGLPEGYKYSSGYIFSRLARRFGYFEIRCKAADNILVTTFWLTGGSSTWRREIDILEVAAGVSASRRKYSCNFHTFATVTPTGIDTTDTARPFNISDIGFELTQDFHVYGLEWRPDVCRFYVDGELVRTADTLDFQIGINILVGLEFNKWLSGKEADQVVDSDIERGGTPVNYLVDYVRTWIQPESPRTLYVDAANGNDAASGLSWSEAKKTINRAAAAALDGDTIWVAGGTYPEQLSLHGLRNLRILGGFAPGATDAAERDPGARPVTVDGIFGHGALSVTSTENVIVEGITFRGTTRKWSSGVELRGPTPFFALRNCSIEENAPEDGAGGGCFIAADNGPITVSFENCTFADNSVLGAFPSGGAVAGRGQFTADFHGCRFLNNTAQAAGGAINLSNAGSILRISNSIFSGNRVIDGLAAIEATNGTLQVDNCTFHDTNKAHIRLTSAGDASTPSRITNSIFSGTTGSALDLNGLASPSSDTLLNCLFFDNGIHVDYAGAQQTAEQINALAFAADNLVADPLFANASGGDFSLGTGSPAIDAGAADTAPPIDLAAVARPQGAGVDIGAFESPVPPPPGRRLVNISTRGIIGATDSKMIGGFVIKGSRKTVLIRGIGPSLAALGVSNAAADPRVLVFRDGDPTPLGENDDWEQQPYTSAIIDAGRVIGAFPLVSGSRDAALLLTVDPGAFTVHLENKATPTTAVGLIEVYEFR